MSSLKLGGLIGTGGLGVLAAAIILSNVLKTGWEWIFGLALMVFVVAGAVALVARSIA